MIEHVPDRPGHDLRYSVDASKVRALGWSPTRTLEDALAATIEWFRTNEAWWRPLKEAGASQRRGAGSSAAGSSAARTGEAGSSGGAGS
jgi:dTDP-glucose 4,6-dehydratase